MSKVNILRKQAELLEKKAAVLEELGLDELRKDVESVSAAARDARARGASPMKSSNVPTRRSLRYVDICASMYSFAFFLM